MQQQMGVNEGEWLKKSKMMNDDDDDAGGGDDAEW